jgi:hypothetical protein
VSRNWLNPYLGILSIKSIRFQQFSIHRWVNEYMNILIFTLMFITWWNVMEFAGTYCYDMMIIYLYIYLCKYTYIYIFICMNRIVHVYMYVYLFHQNQNTEHVPLLLYIHIHICILGHKTDIYWNVWLQWLKILDFNPYFKLKCKSH